MTKKQESKIINLIGLNISSGILTLSGLVIKLTNEIAEQQAIAFAEFLKQYSPSDVTDKWHSYDDDLVQMEHTSSELYSKFLDSQSSLL